MNCAWPQRQDDAGVYFVTQLLHRAYLYAVLFGQLGSTHGSTTSVTRTLPTY